MTTISTLKEDRRSLVWSPFTSTGQETERVCSYNPGARTGLLAPSEPRFAFHYHPYESSVMTLLQEGHPAEITPCI